MTNAAVGDLLARSNLYGLLSRLCRAEVDAEALAELRRPEFASALEEAGFNLAATLPEADDTALLEELARAYAHLFLLTLNPHESVQRGEGQLWGAQTAAVAAFLEEIGLAPAGQVSLLPDHIATELAVMQHLTAEAAAALAAKENQRATQMQELQRRFLKEHLGAWGLEFFGSAERLANHSFYTQVFRLARSFLYTEVA